MVGAEPKEHKHFHPGTRPGGSVTGGDRETVYLGGRFGYFYFSARGKGRGTPRRWEGGRGILWKIPGGESPGWVGAGGEGPGGCLRGILGGGG